MAGNLVASVDGAISLRAWEAANAAASLDAAVKVIPAKPEKWQIESLKEMGEVTDELHQAVVGKEAESTMSITTNVMRFCRHATQLLQWAAANSKLDQEQQNKVNFAQIEAHERWELARVPDVIITYDAVQEALAWCEETLELLDKLVLETPRTTERQYPVPGTKMVLVNVAGYPKEAIEAAVKMMSKVASVIKKRGAGFLLYGPVLLSTDVKRSLYLPRSRLERMRLLTNPNKRKQLTKNSPSTVAAFYHIGSDQLVLQAHIDPTKLVSGTSEFHTKAFVTTVAHELGHRIEHKFGGKLNMAEAKKLYMEGRSKLGGAVGFGVTGGKLVEKGLWQFVSPYSTTSPGEMIAEAFAAFCYPESFTLTAEGYDYKAIMKKRIAVFGTYYKPAASLSKGGLDVVEKRSKIIKKTLGIKDKPKPGAAKAPMKPPRGKPSK